MTSLPRLRTAKRFSSSRFSEAILADRILLIFSWSDQRSSIDIASRSIFFIDILWPYIFSFLRFNVILPVQLFRKWPAAPYFVTEDCFGRYEEAKKCLPMFNDLVHSPLTHWTFFFWLHTCRVAFWAKHMRVMFQFKISTYATKGCLSSQEH